MRGVNWFLYFNSTSLPSGSVIYPSGAESSLTMYLPSGSSLDVARPFSSVVITSTRSDVEYLPVLYTLESSITPTPFPDAAVEQ